MTLVYIPFPRADFEALQRQGFFDGMAGVSFEADQYLAIESTDLEKTAGKIAILDRAWDLTSCTDPTPENFNSGDEVCTKVEDNYKQTAIQDPNKWWVLKASAPNRVAVHNSSFLALKEVHKGILEGNRFRDSEVLKDLPEWKDALSNRSPEWAEGFTTQYLVLDQSKNRPVARWTRPLSGGRLPLNTSIPVSAEEWEKIREKLAQHSATLYPKKLGQLGERSIEAPYIPNSPITPVYVHTLANGERVVVMVTPHLASECQSVEALTDPYTLEYSGPPQLVETLQILLPEAFGCTEWEGGNRVKIRLDTTANPIALSPNTLQAAIDSVQKALEHIEAGTEPRLAKWARGESEPAAAQDDLTPENIKLAAVYNLLKNEPEGLLDDLLPPAWGSGEIAEQIDDLIEWLPWVDPDRMDLVIALEELREEMNSTNWLDLANRYQVMIMVFTLLAAPFVFIALKNRWSRAQTWEQNEAARIERARQEEIRRLEQMSDKEFLDKYTRDYKGQAKKGQSTTVLGRTEDVKELLSLMTNEGLRSGAITGRAGVGKSVFVEEVNRQIALKEQEMGYDKPPSYDPPPPSQGRLASLWGWARSAGSSVAGGLFFWRHDEAPEPSHDGVLVPREGERSVAKPAHLGREIRGLDMFAFSQNIGLRGQLEGRFDYLMRVLARHPEISLFVDEGKDHATTGAAEGGMSLLDMFKAAVAEGRASLFLAMTAEDYNRFIADRQSGQPDEQKARRYPQVELGQVSDSAPQAASPADRERQETRIRELVRRAAEAPNRILRDILESAAKQQIDYIIRLHGDAGGQITIELTEEVYAVVMEEAEERSGLAEPARSKAALTRLISQAYNDASGEAAAINIDGRYALTFMETRFKHPQVTYYREGIETYIDKLAFERGITREKLGYEDMRFEQRPGEDLESYLARLGRAHAELEKFYRALSNAYQPMADRERQTAAKRLLGLLARGGEEPSAALGAAVSRELLDDRAEGLRREICDALNRIKTERGLTPRELALEGEAEAAFLGRLERQASDVSWGDYMDRLGRLKARVSAIETQLARSDEKAEVKAGLLGELQEMVLKTDLSPRIAIPARAAHTGELTASAHEGQLAASASGGGQLVAANDPLSYYETVRRAMLERDPRRSEILRALTEDGRSIPDTREEAEQRLRKLRGVAVPSADVVEAAWRDLEMLDGSAQPIDRMAILIEYVVRGQGAPLDPIERNQVRHAFSELAGGGTWAAIYGRFPSLGREPAGLGSNTSDLRPRR